jgi:hypothetical protein
LTDLFGYQLDLFGYLFFQHFHPLIGLLHSATPVQALTF